MAVSEAEKTQVDEIVHEFMRHQLNLRGLQWNTCPLLPQPSKVALALRRLGEEYMSEFSEFRGKFSEMLHRLDVTPTMLHFIFTDVLNELLSEGITWPRIVSVFAYSVELAAHCVEINMPGMVDSIAFWLSSCVRTRLLPWIKNHEGWDGLVKLSEQSDGIASAESPWPIVKTLVCGLAVTSLGALVLGAFLAYKS